MLIQTRQLLDSIITKSKNEFQSKYDSFDIAIDSEGNQSYERFAGEENVAFSTTKESFLINYKAKAPSTPFLPTKNDPLDVDVQWKTAEIDYFSVVFMDKNLDRKLFSALLQDGYESKLISELAKTETEGVTTNYFYSKNFN